jgi:hypothetical protein
MGLNSRFDGSFEFNRFVLRSTTSRSPSLLGNA